MMDETHRSDMTEHSQTHDDVSDEERRRRKQQRRARKLAKRLAALGLDENGEELDNFSLAKYPVREWKFTIPGMQDRIAINPVVTLLGVVCLWGIVVWCTVDSDNAMAKLAEWRSYLSLTFTWVFQGTKAFFFFFMMYILYKYGHIHMGQNDEKPEFSTLTYATMIFTAGVSNGLLVYGVSEPLSHQRYNFFAQAGYRSQDEVDMAAVNFTVTDWGLGGWAPYSIVAVAMSLAAHRFKLPLIFRSCFYPILGCYTWGWMGDIIDGLTIVVTLVGIFTNLGLAAMNIVAGFVYMGWIEDGYTDEYLRALQNSIIWVITIIALTSVVTGLNGGIKYLCSVAMGLAVLLLFLVFIMEDTKFLLNLQVQELGYYLQNSIFQLNFWTDAFGQLRKGSGRAIDGKAAEQWWMEAWFNFMQAWWVTIAAVNGMFIASISRGRKLWEVVTYSLIVPAGFCMVWFCVWGGIGLRQSRQALELKTLGETYFNNSGHFLADGSELCYHVPQDAIVMDENTVFVNYLPGITPVCEFDEINYNSAVFNVLNSFRFPDSFGGAFGQCLAVVYMITCAVFFMTSAGSASYVVDKLASNGRKNSHLARRMFWLVTVGALATALLQTGGGDALVVLQASVILCGLPCVVLLCYILQSILLLCQAAEKGDTETADYPFPVQPEFSMPLYGGILNIIEYMFSLGNVHQSRLDHGMGLPTRVQVTEFVKGIVVPFVPLKQLLTSTYPENSISNATVTAFYALCYVGWIALWIASRSTPGLNGLMWTFFIFNGIILSVVRSGFRAKYNLRSNTAADLVAGLLLWPQVFAQLRSHCLQSDVRTVEKNASTTSESDVSASEVSV